VNDLETAAVEAAHAEFYAAFETGDLDRMSAVWADGRLAEGVVCVHPGWPMLRGRSEVLRSWALIMANTPYIQFVLTDAQIRVSGDQAVVTCAENILTAAEGSDHGFAPGGSVVTTNVFIRTGTGWRLWLHHSSPVLDREDEDQ
jgi:ketosteroid isomerase-like protein